MRLRHSDFSTTTRREVTRGHLTAVSNTRLREEQTNPKANRRKEGRNTGKGKKEREGGREEEEAEINEIGSRKTIEKIIEKEFVPWEEQQNDQPSARMEE